jgi:hypothetical protein
MPHSTVRGWGYRLWGSSGARRDGCVWSNMDLMTQPESTVFKTMQRMKAPAARPPYIRLEGSGLAWFRVAL